MSFFYPFNPTNFYGLYGARVFIHLTTLVSLMAYQFASPSFINFRVSILGYSLCSLFLLLDAAYLFFYRDNKFFNHYMFFFLTVMESLFFVALLGIIGLIALPFVLMMLFLEILMLVWYKGLFFASVYIAFLSSFLPLSFLWYRDFTYEGRKLLILFVGISLAASLFVGYFLTKFFRKLKQKDGYSKFSIPNNQPTQIISHSKFDHSLQLSLGLARKIKPTIDILQKKTLELKETEKLLPDHYKNQIYQLQKFVSKYIDYSESKKLSFKRLNLLQLLNKVITASQNYKNRPSDLIEKLKYTSLVKWVEASPQHLEKAFESLIENSFQSLKNQPQPWVNILVYDQDRWIVLEFADNGCGIDEEDKSQLFQPFFSKKLGLGGLGLPYVLKVIEAHKGKIEIVSSLKEGTKVIIRLPQMTEQAQKQAISA